MWPSVVSLLSMAAGDEHQGSVQGLAGSASAVASILGLVVGGLFYGVLGSMTFMVASAVIFVVFLLALRVRAAA
jgi:MFS family permease